MSWLLDLVHGVHNWYHGVSSVASSLKKSQSPLRLGILGAAAINPAAIFDPVSTHPDVIIVGIAARVKVRAEEQIKKYRLVHAKAYKGYDAIINDPGIEAVYIPLPNGLHAEWTMKAMRAGKHVLVEKPIASNASQVREIRKVAIETGMLVLEAFHWRLHPAAHLTKSLIASGEYGKVLEVEADFPIPAGAIGKNDIRFNFALAGGSSMDLTYVYSCTSHFAVPSLEGSEVEVLSVKPRRNVKDSRIDEAMTAKYTIRAAGSEDRVLCHTRCDSSQAWLWGIIPKIWEQNTCTIELEKATISFPNFVGPWLAHSIDVRDKTTGKVTKHQAYVDGPEWKRRGERWWTTYRYQLEAFVDGVRAVQDGKTPAEVEKMDGLSWVPLAESEKVMEIIDKVYEKAGMPVRV